MFIIRLFIVKMPHCDLWSDFLTLLGPWWQFHRRPCFPWRRLHEKFAQDRPKREVYCSDPQPPLGPQPFEIGDLNLGPLQSPPMCRKLANFFEFWFFGGFQRFSRAKEVFFMTEKRGKNGEKKRNYCDLCIQGTSVKI